MKCRKCNDSLNIDEQMYNDELCDSCELFEFESEYDEFTLVLGKIIGIVFIVTIFLINV